MPQFCDVALPVPLESVFSYRLDGTAPAVGARVLVPFRKERMVGVVTRLHDSPPAVEIKPVTAVLDEEPALSPALLELGEWIARYYIAPLGEVLRAMLPLIAEFRRAHVLRITASGQQALYQAATGGSSLRSRKPAEEQADELHLLDYLANREEVREATLRSLFPGSRAALASLARKKWIEREDVSATRQAGKFVSYVVLNQEVMLGRQTEQQRMLLEALRATGGRAPLEAMRAISPSALATLAKRGAVKIERERVEYKHGGLKPPSNAQLELTAAQQAALQRINAAMTAGKFHVALLHGVTGSGKTAVYLAAMQAALAAGRTAILLVPEIGLTPAAAAHLAEIFGDAVAILHSALTADERAQQWRRIRSGDAKIVVGTRSAVFAPVERPALIVVDEEQDSSYKQEETPRYHGRDVAVMRGKIENAVVVLVSATPSLESFYNTQQGRYELIELTERVEQRAMPRVELVDMRQEFQHTGEEQIFSRRLSEEVRARLERGEQAIVLLNRRGYSPVVLCRACGESVQCRDCAITLTYHKRANQLECHYCGYRQAVPRVCPKCGSEHVFFLGSGSEKLEEQLHAGFPRARIGRLDRDTVRRRGDFERVLGAFHAGEIDLLVGTQMIAKGHDVHGVTLV
ncbi:MAG TPA: primosomal protein N', partial [Terriglobales bacterium]|nr:primosomal protein N' [Terriglobales bacterium]